MKISRSWELIHSPADTEHPASVGRVSRCMCLASTVGVIGAFAAVDDTRTTHPASQYRCTCCSTQLLVLMDWFAQGSDQLPAVTMCSSLMLASAAMPSATSNRAPSDADAMAGASAGRCGGPTDDRHAETAPADLDSFSNQCAVLSNDAIENVTSARASSEPNTAVAVSLTALAANAKSLSDTVADWSKSITIDTAGPNGHCGGSVYAQSRGCEDVR